MSKKNINSFVGICGALIFMPTIAQALEVTANSLTEKVLTTTPIYGHVYCTHEQLETISKFKGGPFNNVNALTSNAEINSMCDARGCHLDLYYKPEEKENIEFYEQNMKGECLLRNIQDMPSFNLSVFLANINIPNDQLETMNVSYDKLKDVRESKFGRHMYKLKNDDRVELSISYSKKPLFDVITVDGKEIKINFE